MAANNGAKKKIGEGHHVSALKRARQNVKRRLRRKTLTTQMRGQIKQLRSVLEAKNKKEAQALLKTTLPLIAKMASKKIIKRNTAARYSSRLMRRFNSL